MRRFLAVAALALTGCFSVSSYQRPLHVRQAVFNAGEHAPFAGKGDATITGQAFLKTAGGDVKFGAGNIVYLVPATSYTKEWFDHAVILQEDITPPVNEVAALTRTTQADGEGRFKVEAVPPGKYYLTCAIEWMVPGYFAGIALSQRTGGVAYAVVDVAPASTVAAVVTRKETDPPPRLIPVEKAKKPEPSEPTKRKTPSSPEP